MSDRRLVVAEMDPTDPHNGELFAISPNNATGIALPTFRIGTTLPTVGNTVGESFYEQTTKKAFVWSGAAWREIAASPVSRYTNRTALLADASQPVGTFAVTADTGEVYIRQATGWAFIGLREYPTLAQLLADTLQPGSVAQALDELSLWAKTTNGWRCLTQREMADQAAILAWAGTEATGANPGDRALALDTDLQYIRTSSGWRAISMWEDTETNIRNATWPINGQEAIATDTGRTFVRIGGAWVEEPIQHYPTEAALLAATPPDGTLAWGDDTALVYARSAGAWKRVNSPTTTVSATEPTTKANGDVWVDTTPGDRDVAIWDGAKWFSIAGGQAEQPIGTVIQSVLTDAQFQAALPELQVGNWLLMDGRAMPASCALAKITGETHVHDLRGAYLRMAGQNANPRWNGGTLHAYQEDETARPKQHAFTGTAASAGNHSHAMNTNRNSSDWKSGGSSDRALVRQGGADQTAPGGDHTHSVTIDGGGDVETRPKTFVVNYFIKVN